MLVPSGRFRGTEVVDANRKHLEPEELRKVFAQPSMQSTYWSAYFRLQYYFGCRVSEPAILFREDVSLATSEVLLKRLKKRQFGTKEEERDGKMRRVKDEYNKLGDGFTEHVYALPPALLATLDTHLRSLKTKNPWLFPSSKKPRRQGANLERMTLIRRSGGFSAISRWAAEDVFKAAAGAAGVPENLRHSHTLRHTRATLLLAEGASEEDVKDLLGHSNIATTRRYLGVARALRLRLNTTAKLGLGEGW